MVLAIHEARKAELNNNIPIGAIIVNKRNYIVGRGFNQVVTVQDPTLHAEIIAIRCATRKTGNLRLLKCNMYVTQEPCYMCLGAIIHARITGVFYIIHNPKFGVIYSTLRLHKSYFFNHKIIFLQKKVLYYKVSSLLKFFFKYKIYF